MFRVSVALLLIACSKAVFASGLDPQAINRVASSAYQPCLKGAALSAPHIDTSTRDAYCRCYSKRMAELVTSEDVAYIGKFGQPTEHSQRVVRMASDECKTALNIR